MKEKQHNAPSNITLAISQKQDKVNANMPSQKVGWRQMVTPLALASVTAIGIGILAESANLKFNYSQETTYEGIVGSEKVIDMVSLDDLKQEAKELAIEAVFGDDFEDDGSNINPSGFWWGIPSKWWPWPWFAF